MSAIGQLVGYGVGSIDTVSILGTFLGDTQFKQMTVIAAMFLVGSVLVTSYSVKERILITARLVSRAGNDKRKATDEVLCRGGGADAGAMQVISQLLKTTMELPPRIQAICWAQFWAWIGWFPFLFYSTTWVGETYFRYEVPKGPTQSEDILGEVGRIGSLSLVVFSSITFVGSVLLPFCVQSPDYQRSRFTPRPPPGMAAILKKITAIRPNLQTTWWMSHFVFAATMIFAPFARSRAFATALVAICGIPWAISSWAPFAFMGIEINKLAIDPSTTARYSGVTMITSSSIRRGTYTDPNSGTSTGNADTELDVLRLNHGDPHDEFDPDNPDLEADSDSSDNNDPSSTGELAGIYLGVLNVYTTLPQFVGTFISWIVFSILEPASVKRDVDVDDADADAPTAVWMNLDRNSPNAISVCLFIGALSALVASEATRRMKYAR